MTELKQHTGLLILLALLFALKFIVVPIFDWQDNQLLNIVNQEKKLAKVSHVLAKEGLFDDKNKVLAEKLQSAERLVFAYQPEAEFKLNRQQQIEQLLDKHNISSLNIGWQTATPLSEFNMIKYQLQVSFNGSFINIVKMFTELESSEPWLQIDDFNISTRSNQLGIPGSSKNARLKINVYMNMAGTND
ncbi:GspMb/PilO family protein [Thalassotalea castellviae]|uniref:GspMb/PilO family protein n=1 Tax=Thalassotalea castellviae TaxID=3075612 RepID=A0ABU2ZY12_9GAMM|nr:GspMb/PilO family protein [Thalassotalea sp. W431]MDT0602811.1 GspMb/PilO family protein [Thalassotalea sp. W431]